MVVSLGIPKKYGGHFTTYRQGIPYAGSSELLDLKLLLKVNWLRVCRPKNTLKHQHQHLNLLVERMAGPVSPSRLMSWT